ncbi:MAG TPA: hypothetical protein PLV86_04485 [Candidatus Fermentibacter daniensis]|nr:hypothetical protein [Candidatus Fermentibacter daniensis]HQM40999.1 hypothetical protein [Candidatus Fermentibacter daniensis]
MNALVMLMALSAAGASGQGLMERLENLIDQARSNVNAVEAADPTRLSGDFSVVELFRAETPEELEAAVANGYPMPWLAEVLSDESIPEEDRYWIDCRMRAAIAQDLHLFFDRRGNPVRVSAAYIGPGEDYWREHLMVSPVGARDLPEENRPTRSIGGRGYILDVYGDRVGALAEARGSVSLDRDASFAAIPSGGSSMFSYQEPFACFMYPDGSFREEPFGYVAVFDATVGPNGEMVVFRCHTHAGYGFDPVTNEPLYGPNGDAYIFDSRGNLLQRVTPPSLFSGSKVAQISADGRYICSFLCTGELFLIDCEDGELAVFSVSDASADYLYLYDRNAREQACVEIEAYFFSSPVISPDNSTIVLRMNGTGFSGGQLLDVSTGRVLNSFLYLVEQPCFSQNSERVSLTGGVDTRILDTADGSVERTYPFRTLEIPIVGIVGRDPQGPLSVSISNNPSQIVSMRHYGVRIILDGISRLLVPGFNIGDLSPNGYFAWLSSTYRGRMTSSVSYGGKLIILDMERFEEVGR